MDYDYEENGTGNGAFRGWDDRDGYAVDGFGDRKEDSGVEDDYDDDEGGYVTRGSLIPSARTKITTLGLGDS